MSVANSTAFKRQKLRKGTFSCWECKNRKIRCEYQSPADSTCKSCQRRGAQCLSQEYIEVRENGYDHVGDRIDRMETMVSQLLKTKRKYASDQHIQNISPDEPEVMSTLHATRIPSVTSASQQSLNECFSLSHYLHSILPKPAVTMMIFTQGNYFQMPTHLLRRPKNPLNSQEKPESLLVQMSKKPPPTAHPVIFAQKLYRLALCMQRLNPTTLYEGNQNFKKESVDDALRRFVEIASKHVTSHDTLMASLDGLETLMLESFYHVNTGNNRAAWLTMRRALGIAELMGLRTMKADDSAESMWYLLNTSDRYLSAMAGLPCNGSDESFATERVLACKSPVERLSRTHVVILGRIIARNIQIQPYTDSDNSDGCFNESYRKTQAIDRDLKQAARILPMDSWATPNLSSSAADKDLMERTSILLVQIHHYYSIYLLHQPYLLHLRSHSKEVPYINGTIDYTYSKLTALSASRELLSRFVVMRDIHHSTSYRGADDKAFIASVTLLLAHIDAHQSDYQNNPLAHQRQQDLATVHRLTKRFDNDVATIQSAQQLRSLLQMEEKAANGAKYYFTWSADGKDNSDAVQIWIPYFGSLSVLPSKQETLLTYKDPAAVPGVENSESHPVGLPDNDLFQSISYDLDNSFPTSQPVPDEELPPSFSLNASDDFLLQLDSILQPEFALDESVTF